MKITAAKIWDAICRCCGISVASYDTYTSSTTTPDLGTSVDVRGLSGDNLLSKDNVAIANLLKKKHVIAIANKINTMIFIGLDFMKNV